MKPNVYNRQKALPLSKVSVKKIVKVLSLYLSIQCEELSIYFVDTQMMCRLHKQFFNDPAPTDCMTFPIDCCYLGDIFISPQAALRYAPNQPYQETLLYLIHGLLHLLGYDDLKPTARRTMRKMEKKCMDHLNKLGLNLKPA